jgi:hypothetical protein
MFNVRDYVIEPEGTSTVGDEDESNEPRSTRGKFDPRVVAPERPDTVRVFREL